MRSVLYQEGGDHQVADIKQLVERAETQYKSLNALPYSEIVKFVASFQGRSRRNKRRDKD